MAAELQMSGPSLSPSLSALELAELLKQTHKSLRENFQESENAIETVWSKHAENKEHLQKYAEAMHTLATKHWETTDNVSRINWIHDAITQYFHKGDIHLRTQKERRKVSVLRSNELICFDDVRNTLEEHDDSRLLNTLDVGSCYNPFSQFEDLNVTPIDLHPAKPDVFKCDFLKLRIRNGKSTEPENGKGCTNDEDTVLESDCLKKAGGEALETGVIEDENLKKTNKRPVVLDDDELEKEKKTKRNKVEEFKTPTTQGEITELENGSFDVVIFCLFLEYIPCPKLRFLCCQKAYSLLKPNGLLCIVTPDSKHATANVHLFKLWKISLSNLGFNRVKYEKCTHFHGMVFRKGIAPSVWQEDASRELAEIKDKQLSKRFIGIDYDKVLNSVYILQDLESLRNR